MFLAFLVVLPGPLLPLFLAIGTAMCCVKLTIINCLCDIFMRLACHLFFIKRVYPLGVDGGYFLALVLQLIFVNFR